MAFLKRFLRAILIGLGLVLIAIFIWIAGPYFAFGDFHPFESATVRLVLIGLVVACWVGSVLLKRWRAYRASDRLLASVMAQPQAEPTRSSAEAAKLRERFETAVATLKEHRTGGHSLYDLPWYVMIGAPGSGKTTALVNSGLRFPLENRLGKEALTGVGGTRNCDWWFTDEAVFLDTAGRYTTQDSDAASDSAAWREFLALLRKYRGRRPVNGVILTINARDLMVQSEATLAGHVEATHRRLTELNRELQIQVPVYLMVTKCDLVAGFTEYFEDQTQDGRAQVWGVTFPYETTMSGEAAQSFPAEFDDLMGRLNQKVFARVEDSREVRRRAKVFAFPQQMGALREPLSQFIAEVFGSTLLDQRVLLRGVYFTSGTQEGTPVDRLLGAIGRRFGVAAEAVAPSGPGKAYFVERLLKEVLIGESGLAGVNRRLETKKAAAQLGAYAAMAVLGILGLFALTVSYTRNRAYLDDVAKEVATLQAPAPAGNSLDAALPRFEALDAVVKSADRHRDSIPWSMRWGLFQGTLIGDAARDAYTRTLDGLLLPRVTELLRARVRSSTDPQTLYGYLKAYLMLGQPQHLDKKYLQFIVDREWASANGSTTGPTLSKHFKNLLDYRDTLRPMTNDATLVGQAQNSIRQASLPRIMYGQIQAFYSEDGRKLVLTSASGIGSEQVFTRKSGRSLADPLPAMYTRDVFKEVTGQDVSALVKQYAGEDWVWGNAGAAGLNTPNLKELVIGQYEQDYIDVWESTLADLQIVQFKTASEMAEGLRILTSPTSPLRGLLQTVVNHTALVGDAAAGASASSGLLESAKKKITDLNALVKPLKEAVGVSATDPGAIVTARFQPISQLLAGEKGTTRIDQIFGLISQIEQQLRLLGPDVSGRDPMDALKSSELNALWQTLQREASTLPPPVNTLIGEIVRGSREAVVVDATGGFEASYVQQVLQPCRALVDGRYPFATSQNEVKLADFSMMFGYGGVFDKFFEANLADQVDVSHRPWTWRAGSVAPSNNVLVQFEAARLVRDRFFPAGANTPHVGFILSLSGLDAAAQLFTLQVDNQSTNTSRPGFRWTVEWPGKGSAGEAVATFQDRFGPQQVHAFRGPWALFRLIDATASPSAAGTVLGITDQNHRVQVSIETESALNNPFAMRDWRDFHCGS